MIDLILASQLAIAVPHLPPASPVFSATTIARSYSGGSRSFSGSSRSFSGGSRSSSPSNVRTFSQPMRSSSGNIVINRQRVTNTPHINTTPIRSSSGAISITKQKAPQSPIIPKAKNNISPGPSSIYRPQTTQTQPTTVYVDRGPDLLTNILLWDAITEDRRQKPVVVNQTKDNTQVITKTVEGYNPGRELAVFCLGSGLTVLGLKTFGKV
jgi:hypothetical protein